MEHHHAIDLGDHVRAGIFNGVTFHEFQTKEARDKWVKTGNDDGQARIPVGDLPAHKVCIWQHHE